MHEKKKWNSKETELHENKIIEELKKDNQSIYTTKLLQQCKTWGGTCSQHGGT